MGGWVQQKRKRTPGHGQQCADWSGWRGVGGGLSGTEKYSVKNKIFFLKKAGLLAAVPISVLHHANTSHLTKILQFSGHGTCLSCCGPGSLVGVCERQPMFLSLSSPS